MHVLRKAILAAACTTGLAAAATPALAQTTLRAVMHSDLKILDPIWTTAYIVRNHGYMIYDTLSRRTRRAPSSRRWSRSTRPQRTARCIPSRCARGCCGTMASR